MFEVVCVQCGYDRMQIGEVVRLVLLVLTQMVEFFAQSVIFVFGLACNEIFVILKNMGLS